VATIGGTYHWDSDSSSYGEDERRRRRRNIVTYTATSALAEVNTSLDGRMRSGSRPGKSANRDSTLCQGAIELYKDYFDGLGLVSAPRLELDLERRYRMPRALLYERVRVEYGSVTLLSLVLSIRVLLEILVENTA
jgi:hypothetical protein